MGDLLRDVKIGVRRLARGRLSTLVALGTIALGVGANAAVFSAINGVLLRPLPYPDPDRLVGLVRNDRPDRLASFTASELAFWQAHAAPFEHLAAVAPAAFDLGQVGRPRRVQALRVSASYFGALGVQPALGRSFLANEDRIGGRNVVVVSHGFWMRDLGGDPHPVGSTVALDGVAFAVVGVMPSDFESTPQADIWTTVGQVAASLGSGSNYEVIGRLRQGVARQQANAYLSSLAGPFSEVSGQRVAETSGERVVFAAAPLGQLVARELRAPLLLLLGATLCVLLIACANVANLQLAQANTRERELAVRVAVGASRRRILTQVLAENTVVAAGGGALGLALAPLCVRALATQVPAGLPRARGICVGWSLVGFTALVAVASGLVIGAVVAGRVCRRSPGLWLTTGTGAATSGRNRLGSTLVAGEVALSLVLLAQFALFAGALARLLRTDPGFDPHNLLAVQVWTAGIGRRSPAALARVYEHGVDRIDAIPGVVGAAFVGAGPPLEKGGNDFVRLGVEDHGGFSADCRAVTPGYFNTVGLRLIQGRIFGDHDDAGKLPVAIVNEALARARFQDANPVGKRLVSGSESLEIVGVVSDVQSRLGVRPPETYFVPMAQASLRAHRFFEAWYPTTVLVRTRVRPATLRTAVQEALWEVEPDLPIGEVRTMDDVLSQSMARQRFLTTMMALFATLAVVMAAVGLYGVVSYSVGRRTREVALRMAMGATARRVAGRIVLEGQALALPGLAVGVLAARAAEHTVAATLLPAESQGPWVLGAAALTLLGVTALASYVPARRAARLQPAIALRRE